MKDHNFCEPINACMGTSSGNGAPAISMTNSVKIATYQPEHQAGIEALVLPIQQHEFGVAISREEQPDLLDIAATFQSGHGNFWVAMVEDSIIGCIGLVDIGDGNAALKKMFVHKDYRGKQAGVSRMLIQTAKTWAAAHNIKTIFLGTVSQMLAAHKFYESNGFAEITVPQLPASFPLVHVDTKFYRCDLG